MSQIPAAGLLTPAPTRIMGVLNVTPDSFSDGGRWLDHAAAVEHGRRMMAEGADLVDVGGESTRPGSVRPSEQEELDRVLPVVEELVGHGIPVSIDTMRATVAAAAVGAGAALVNDVSGGLADDAMPSTVAGLGVPFVAMHWRGLLADPQEEPHYEDVVGEVRDELAARVEALVEEGIARELVVLDPGFGFSKDAGHNWLLLRGLSAITGLGLPVLVGTSRKRFLGRLPLHTAAPAEPRTDGEPTPPDERDAATAATSLLAAQAGAWAVRVHDIPSTRDALAVHRLTEAAR
ncbi:dihydropteroate synthase [Ornithinimicrobium sp. Y1694]|uniref:dihydropteroate synthase n=1 Tax=Ornithinimicrobium sp. Y1694 TaxID=3418590 RepID=UPI003CEDB61E